MIRLKRVEFKGYETVGAEQVACIPHVKLPGVYALYREDIRAVVVKDREITLAWVPFESCTLVPEDEVKPDARGISAPASRARAAK